MKNKYISLIILTLVFVELFGQQATNTFPIRYCRYSNNAFTAVQNATASDLSSDFGVRKVTGGTLFHRGVDFAPVGNQNIVLSAPFRAQITEIIASTNQGSIKIIEFKKADNDLIRFRILHIFNNGNYPINFNGFKLRIDNGRPIIINTIDSIMYSSTVFQTTFDGQPHSATNPWVNTRNIIEVDAPFVPIGNSGEIKPGVAYAYHAHISQLESAGASHNSKTESIDALRTLTVDGNTERLHTRLRGRNATPAINLNSGAACEEHNTDGAWGQFYPKYTNNSRNIIETEVFINNATPTQDRCERYSNANIGLKTEVTRIS